MRRTNYSVTAGTYTAIPSLQFARRVDIEEDGTVAMAGLAIKFPDDGFTAIFSYPPKEQPVILGNQAAFGAGDGMILGMPAQTGLHARAADIYAMVTSLAGTTNIRVTEWD